MREILFRGKRVDNGEWVYWDRYGRITDINGESARVAIDIPTLLPYPTYMYICDFPVINDETVGDYTGVVDKNDKRIFEGDIVKLFNEYVAVVIFESAMFLVKCEGYNFQFSQEDSADIEVIGNMFDNPELLEVKE